MKRIIKIFLVCLIVSLIVGFLSGEDTTMWLMPTMVIFAFSLPLYVKGIVYLVKFIWNLFGKIVGGAEKGISQFGELEFKKYKKYYRDILNISDPLILGYLDDYKINKSTLVAQLLYMKNKELIIIENGEIKRNDNNIKRKLSKSEKQILNKIKNNKLVIEDYDSFIKSIKEIVHAEAQRHSLIVKDNYSNFGKKLKKASEWIKQSKQLKIITALLLVIFFVFCNIPIRNNKIVEDIGGYSILLLMVIVSIYAFAYFFYRGYDDTRIKNICARTKKGEKLNERLEGLKNYIKDFSILSEREAKEIVLWEDYLIYSIIFGHNKKVIKEYENYIEII